MMKRIMLMLLAALLLPLCAQAEETGYVQETRVHLRAAASTEAESLGLYFRGTEVTVLDDLGEWLHVQIGAARGFMMSEYVAEEARWGDGFIYRLTETNGLYVNLRAEPSLAGEVLTTCRVRQPVLVMGETASGWSYVSAKGHTGYILTDLLRDCPEAETSVLTTTPGGYIHMLSPPINFQCLYYVAMDEEPRWIYDDVNFDGYADIVVHTSIGATNFRSEFFVYDPEKNWFTRAEHGLDDGIFNYQLYPEGGYVLSHSTNGNAGMLHRYDLFRWEDGQLRLLRTAQSVEKTDTDLAGDVLTTVMHLDTYAMRVRDFTQDPYEGRVIWSAEFVGDGESEYEMLQQEQQALWQGL